MPPADISHTHKTITPHREHSYAESRLFSNLSHTVPYTKHPLLPADAAGKRPSQSAVTLTTKGVILCDYPRAEFQRQPHMDE
jgi:hypothetical protein